MQINRIAPIAGVAGVFVSLGAAASIVGACASQTSTGYDDAGPNGTSGTPVSNSGSSGSNTGSSGGFTSGSNGGTGASGSRSGSTTSGTSNTGTTGSFTGTSGNGSGGSASGTTAGTGTASGTSSGTGTASGSSGTGTASGTSSGTTSGTATGSTSGPTAVKACGTTATTCSATTAANALLLASDYQSAVGTGGYAYVICDPSGSTACIPTTALCAAGTTLAGPGSAMVYGSGFGINIGQAAASTTAGSFALPATATGIKYAFSALPTNGIQVIIDTSVAGVSTDFCAPVNDKGPGVLPWSAFTQYCQMGGKPLGSAAPVMPTHINFQVPVGSGAGTYDFCATSIGFAP